jgi:DNA-binding NtrC family response regulator
MSMPATVLVVDDELGLRELLTRWLSAAKYVVLKASDAEEAVAVLAQSPEVNVVIADLQMPGRGGAWLVDQMLERFPSIAVVLATADDQVPGTLSLQPSVVGYLVKPLDRDALLRAVRKGVARRDEYVERARIRRATDPLEI